MRGKPLERSSQITDKEAINQALEALVYGGDDPKRDTKAKGYPTSYAQEDDIMWFEELQDIDNMISEEVGENVSMLPSAGRVEQIGHLQDKLWTWFAAPIPRWERRILREAINELAGLGNVLREGKVPTMQAQEQFDTIYAEVSNILDWSKLQTD